MLSTIERVRWFYIDESIGCHIFHDQAGIEIAEDELIASTKDRSPTKKYSIPMLKRPTSTPPTSTPLARSAPTRAAPSPDESEQSPELSAQDDRRLELETSQTVPAAPTHASSNNARHEPRRRRWLRLAGIVTALVGVIAAVAAITRNATPDVVAGTTMTHTITRGDLQVTVTEKGTLESSNNVEVRSKVWGWKTVNWVIESGVDVKKGDLLVELDASEMEKKVDDAKINFHNARADMITAESNVAVAGKSIVEYLQGTFVEERGSIKQEIFDAEQAVTRAELAHASSMRLAAKGLINPLQLKGDQFKLDSSLQTLELKRTRLRSLEEFKKEKQQEKLESDLRAGQARLDAAKAKVDLSKTNVEQHEDQLRFHTISAPQNGMVIHPKAAAHRGAPDVEEGANVHTNQVLLIMPDLDQMQVKLGVHESMIDRVHKDLVARVTVGEVTLDGKVSEVAKVTKPATWYTGNVVKFDTIVSLEDHPGLKPGLSASVEIVIAEHNDVLTVPVAAVVESGKNRLCWVKTPSGAKQRELKLGDSNDQFIVVESGLTEGDEVILNPVAFLDEAQVEAMKLSDESSQADSSDVEPPSEPSSEPSGS